MLKSDLKSLYIKLIKIITESHIDLYRYNIAFVISFNGEVNLIKDFANHLSRKSELIVYYTNNAKKSAKILAKSDIKTVKIANNLKFLFKTVPKMMTDKLIICDNYYPFLAGFKLPSNVRVIQLWHADGAVKQFGWGDTRTRLRSRTAQKRFQAVYNTFTDFVVGSRAMENVFKHDWRLNNNKHFITSGYPRSTKLLTKTWYDNTQKNIYQRYPRFKHKRIILYAPTYRPNVTLHLPSDIKESLTADKNAIVIIKVHPALSKKLKENLEQKLSSPHIYFCHQFSTTQLMTIAETLVTDYSSVVFDYSLLPNAKSLILFWFDSGIYARKPSLQKEFLNNLPVKPIHHTDELTKAIKENKTVNFKHFNQVWNTYNNRNANQKFTKYCLNNNK